MIARTEVSQQDPLRLLRIWLYGKFITKGNSRINGKSLLLLSHVYLMCIYIYTVYIYIYTVYIMCVYIYIYTLYNTHLSATFPTMTQNHHTEDSHHRKQASGYEKPDINQGEHQRTNTGLWSDQNSMKKWTPFGTIIPPSHLLKCKSAMVRSIADDFRFVKAQKWSSRCGMPSTIPAMGYWGSWAKVFCWKGHTFHKQNWGFPRIGGTPKSSI